MNKTRDPYLSIDWKLCQIELNELQNRLTTAAIKDDWKKVKILQDNITRSFSERALAVRGVLSNRGENTLTHI